LSRWPADRQQACHADLLAFYPNVRLGRDTEYRKFCRRAWHRSLGPPIALDTELVRPVPAGDAAMIADRTLRQIVRLSGGVERRVGAARLTDSMPLDQFNWAKGC
jgi:hypothetical protein